MVVLESTANGIGGYFYDEWQRAKNGESDFVALFFAWFEEPAYEMEVPDGFEPTEEERGIIRRYPQVTYRKLVWRRWCIKNNCGGDTELFKQEYPSDDNEAFLVSGRPRFDIPILREYLDQCTDGKRGYLERINGEIRFIPDPKGYIEVWDRPQGDSYIGADVAKGLITGDASAAAVFDDSYSLNALWHGRIDPDLFADQLAMLGTHYRNALLVVEENNHGLTVLNKLKQDYDNLYYRTSHNKLTDEVKRELGWYTSEQTKKLAIDHLAYLIRERKLRIKSRRFIEECMTYVREDDGKTNAQQGSFDDIVMASAIVLFAMEQHATPVMPIVSNIAERPVEHGSFVRDALGGFKHKDEPDDDEESNWFKRAGW
jgi:hypothetical protein